MRRIFYAISSRMGAGAWRSRKQFIWGFALLSGILLVYIQYSPITNSNSYALEEDLQQRRSLNSYGRKEGDDFVMNNNKVSQRVRFVDNDYLHNENSNVEKDPKDRVQRYPPPDENEDMTLNKDTIFRNDVVPNDESETGRQSEALRLLEERIREKETAESQRTAQNLQIPVINNAEGTNMGAGNEINAEQPQIYNDPWTGGNLRYNNFGEPVYEHGNRPNYIPKQRVVHFDLKGAPPKSSILVKLIPWLAKHGATTILLEYEDMFPWDGSLSSFAAKNHYTRKEIKSFLSACKDYDLDVIPLVQTFGHLEFVLKGKLFSYLREVPEIPQALCPSKNDSTLLVRAMIDQVMELHPKAKYLHIGCDEVFQLAECDKCRALNREDLFVSHVGSVAQYVKKAYGIKSLIWHDMIAHVSNEAMEKYKFKELIEPMIWVYAEDVYRFVQPYQFQKLGEIFPYVWAASAFKGAFGEQEIAPNVRRHLDNNLNWLDVMAAESNKFTGGFRGLVLTGWQRYDHFAVLCETLPASMPSLALNLIATSHGYFNATIEDEIFEALKCVQNSPSSSQSSIDLDRDPFLWEKFSWCFFPGSQAFKMTGRLTDFKVEVRAYLDKVKYSRGWITDYNMRHNFSSPMRVDQDLEELPIKLQTIDLMIKTATTALSEWFDTWTVGEWIEQQLWPTLNELKKLSAKAESLKNVNAWPVRPLRLLPELSQYGISSPELPGKKSSKRKRKSLSSKKTSNDLYESKQNSQDQYQFKQNDQNQYQFKQNNQDQQYQLNERSPNDYQIRRLKYIP